MGPAKPVFCQSIGNRGEWVSECASSDAHSLSLSLGGRRPPSRASCCLSRNANPNQLTVYDRGKRTNGARTHMPCAKFSSHHWCSARERNNGCKLALALFAAAQHATGTSAALRNWFHTDVSYRRTTRGPNHDRSRYIRNQLARSRHRQRVENEIRFECAKPCQQKQYITKTDILSRALAAFCRSS